MSSDKTRDVKAHPAKARAAIALERERARSLPERPNLAQLKKQARELCDQVRTSSPEAIARVRQRHPRAGARPPLDERALRLSDAQLVIAREYGFASWSKLKHHVERLATSVDATVAGAVAPGEELPLLAVRDAVLFPGAKLVLDVGRARSLAALRSADTAQQLLFCALQRDAAVDAPNRGDLHSVGTVAEVQWTKQRPNCLRVQVRGLASARILTCVSASEHDRVTVERLTEPPLTDAELLSCILRLHAQLERIARASERLSIPELAQLAHEQDLPGLIGLGAAQVTPSERQRWLELRDTRALVAELCAALEPLAAQAQVIPEVSAPSPGHDAPAALVLVLYCWAHPHLRGRAFPLQSACTQIGRATPNDIVLHSDAVSRQHARIERRGEAFVLIDAASTNGTFAGPSGEVVQEHVLTDGERFAVGDTLLCFLSGPSLAEKQREVIADLADNDALTLVLSRSAFHARLEQAVLLARSDETPLSLLLIGVDDMREHNQALGNMAGDQLLRRVGALLRDRAGSSALTGRYAGDVFAVALPRTAIAQAHALGERLQQELSAAEPAGRGVSVTFSLGTATLHRTTGAGDLIDAALEALRRAQRGPGGQHGPGVAA